MHVPQRMCVSCKKRCNKNSLIRISKQNEIPIIDMNKKSTSKAIYVCKDEKCIEILKKSKAIQRLLKVEAKDDFYLQIKNTTIDK